MKILISKLMSKLMLICLSLNIVVPASAKVIIFTYAYNKPEFIELQYKTFQKFLMDDYEFIVINDANNKEMAAKIIDTCNAYQLNYINIPQEIHERPYLDRPNEGYIHFIDHQSPCTRNCNVVQYSLDRLEYNPDDIIALFDSDLFSKGIQYYQIFKGL